MSPAFERMIRLIERKSDEQAGEGFVWLGDDFKGVPQEAGVDFAGIAMGGTNSKADYILTCSAEQFTERPSVGKDGAIIWRGAEWKIVEIKNPGDPFSVVMHVTKRVK